MLLRTIAAAALIAVNALSYQQALAAAATIAPGTNDYGEVFNQIAPRNKIDAIKQQVTILRNVRYGNADLQTMDVYLPRKPQTGMPVIFMVHGGAWRFGDKTARSVVLNKVARWVPRGFILVSVNYRMLPTARLLQQAEDVARALATAQAKAASRGGDPAKFILMGHSAGAHLVALLDADPALAYKAGARPWLGVVARGREEARAQLGAFFDVFPDYRFTAEGIAAGDGDIACWGRVRMTFAGGFPGLAPAGRTAGPPAGAGAVVGACHAIAAGDGFDRIVAWK